MQLRPASHPSEGSTAEQCAECARLRACKGCFEELVRRFQSSLLHYLLRRVKSRDDAEDLLQETFLIAYRKLDTYRSSWRFSTWLFTIAHRLAVSDWRRRTAYEAAASQRIEQNSPVDPLHHAQEKEQQGGLWDMAERVLEAEPLAALWLSYVESMPADQIGLVLGRNANAVRILLHRARARLREALNAQEASLESRHE